MSLIARLPKVKGSLRENVNLAKFCWFQVGGIASALYKPQDVADLQFFLKNLDPGIPFFIFGVGSNMLISDKGFPGVAIRLGREFNYAHKITEDELVVGAATLDVNLADFACEHSIAGFEFLSGIPGTIGGALAMNAGAYGSEIKDILISARAVNKDGELREFGVADLGYFYRGNSLGGDWFFVDARLKGRAGNKLEIMEKIKQIQVERNATQPVRAKTGGSTFKNPEGHKAWQLIDAAGCRGLRIGDAQVSEFHCNFFLNLGSATAADLLNLINEVKERVYKTSGIILKEEIKIVG
ncbi:MAG: UDP-N-acetylmuramate dehydrogenase [Candidatus Jidaibacter sp.]|jgi:UDP-N-acetylmuramate dehydrogenase|nr:UDP-N-acetylmuramate dehydrogenase [Candidatus Jidaibacter sp.]